MDKEPDSLMTKSCTYVFKGLKMIVGVSFNNRERK